MEEGSDRNLCGRECGETLRWQSSKLRTEVAMLGTAALWMVLTRDKRSLMTVAAVLLFIVLAVLAWNLAP
jgi:type II secretory pathway component PulM